MGRDLLLILAVVAGVAAGQTFLKLGMLKVGPIDRSRMLSPLPLVSTMVRTVELSVGVSLYVLSAAGWMVVLSRSDLSFAYPFMGLAYGFVPFVGVVLLGEPFSRLQLLGLALVIVGVVTVVLTGTAG
ncbi:MAG: hypothetical protein KKA32_12830 [Actinobacteria bacterium]|nr:hypothetical protein [Actinomycetota bacterium]